jgi:hypothetical protein
MLKLAVLGAQTLLGRELVQALEACEASVLPLSTGPLTRDEEEGDIVIFAPEPSLLVGLDAVVLADTPDAHLLEHFPGRILDLRPDATEGELLPFGPWPEGEKRLRLRPALEQVLGLLPQLVSGLGELSGTWLRSVAYLGDLGVDALHEQTEVILRGEDPNTERLGYRAAFELVPQAPRGPIAEVRVPVFHGDLLVLHLRAAEGNTLKVLAAPQGVTFVDAPPTSREVATSAELLAHYAPMGEGQKAVLTLGFDPILWGALRPTLRVFGLR